MITLKGLLIFMNDIDVSEKPTRLFVLHVVGILLCLGSVLAFAVLQYRMPENIRAYWGMNHRSISQFTPVFLGPQTPLEPSRFFYWFQASLLSAWCGWCLTVISGYYGRCASPKWLLLAGGATALCLATLIPPSLSVDSYVYLAYGHVQALYGVNSYIHTPLETLTAHGDPTVPYIGWNFPNSYGPLWTLIVSGISLLLRGSLLWQVIAVRCIGMISLVGLGWVGRKIADHLEPGRGALSCAALVLNPLLLIEGPMHGHNDMLMMFLFMAGIWMFISKRDIPALLLIGGSISVKLLTLAVAPWLALAAFTDSSRLRARLKTAAMRIALLIAPFVLLLLPLWDGPQTLSGLRGRALAGRAAKSHYLAMNAWLIHHGITHSLVSALSPILTQIPMLAVYAILTIWPTLLCKRPLSWLYAWILLTMLMPYIFVGIWFPWYMCWFFVPALIRWRTVDKILIILSLCITMYYQPLYIG